MSNPPYGNQCLAIKETIFNPNSELGVLWRYWYSIHCCQLVKGAWDTIVTSGRALRTSQVSLMCWKNAGTNLTVLLTKCCTSNNEDHAWTWKWIQFVYKPYSLYANLEYFNSFQTHIYICPNPWKWRHEAAETCNTISLDFTCVCFFQSLSYVSLV